LNSTTHETQEFDLVKESFMRRFAGELGQHFSKLKLLKGVGREIQMISSNIKNGDTAMSHKPAAVPLIVASIHDIKHSLSAVSSTTRQGACTKSQQPE